MADPELRSPTGDFHARVPAAGTSSRHGIRLSFAGMTEDLRRQLVRLRRERDRLETLLARHPAWTALRQHDARPAAVGPVEAARHARRKLVIERQLAGHPVFEAFRCVCASVSALESNLAADLASRGDEATPRTNRTDGGVVAPTTQDAPPSCVAAGEKELPNRSNDVSPATSDRRAPGASTAARIHRAPPGMERAGDDGRGLVLEPDDLTRIRGIDRGLAGALVALGVKHFEQIAGFTSADVRSLAAALSLGRRISRENWIEQAAMLALRRRKIMSAPPPASIEAPAPPRISPVAQAVTAIVAGVAKKSVRREAPSVVTAEVSALVSDSNEPARLVMAEAVPQTPVAGGSAPAVPVHDLIRSVALGISGRARGHEPADGSAMAAAVTPRHGERDDARVVESEDTEEKPITLAVPEDRAGGAEPAPPVPDVAMTELHEAAAQAVDDLTLIYGIDTEISARLAALRVTRFAQIAAWDAATVRNMASRLEPPADVYGHGWIAQAAALAKGSVTDHMRRVKRGDYAALVPWPAVSAKRDETFATWLAMQSRGLGSAIVEKQTMEATKPAAGRELAADDATHGQVGTRLSEPRLTIADRITAIERDAARLTIGAQATLRGDAALAKDGRGSGSRRSVDAATIANQLSPASEEPEAEVLIVRREAQSAGAEGPSGAPHAEGTQGSQGTQGTQPARVAGAATFDTDDYAGYREEIEEASVTIVRHGPSAGPTETPGTSALAANRPDAAVSVRRFLRALKGE